MFHSFIFYRPWPLYAFGLGVCLLYDFFADPFLRLPNEILRDSPALLPFAITDLNF